jgi:hypothetical protein
MVIELTPVHADFEIDFDDSNMKKAAGKSGGLWKPP